MITDIEIRSLLNDEERDTLLNGLKLLADDTRLRLLELLSQGEMCVCHLVDALGLPQGTVSHHLGILRRAGWVRDRREQKDYRWTYYSLNPERIRELQSLLSQGIDLERAARPAEPCV